MNFSEKGKGTKTYKKPKSYKATTFEFIFYVFFFSRLLVSSDRSAYTERIWRVMAVSRVF